MNRVMRSREERTVAIIGGGFSGVAVAVQLMRRSGPNTSVVLINESGPMGRGLAYGTQSSSHVLNVPAGNMSALADDPDNFLRFCRWNAPQLQPEVFLPRQLYGNYLESLLSALEVSVDDAPRFRRVIGRATSAIPTGGGQAPESVGIQLDNGQLVRAQEVVLAFGHFSPRSPLTANDEAVAGQAYVRDPWRPGVLASIEADQPVVLIGAGLTAVDVALSLRHQMHTGPIVSISRHGLGVLPHRSPAPVHQQPDGSDLCARLSRQSLRWAVRTVRDEARSRLDVGLDWRDLLNALRAKTPELWRGLSPSDRARFLRHVRPHWEVLRHRCAPQAFSEHEELVATGQLVRLAARVDRVRRENGRLEVMLRQRGSSAVTACPAQAIINCTGPETDVSRSGSTLVQQLLADGFLVPDPLRLGLQVDDRYRALGRDGNAVPWLRYVGPLLRAVHWEATAVPELRVHAARLAKSLSIVAEPQMQAGAATLTLA